MNKRFNEEKALELLRSIYNIYLFSHVTPSACQISPVKCWNCDREMDLYVNKYDQKRIYCLCCFCGARDVIGPLRWFLRRVMYKLDSE